MVRTPEDFEPTFARMVQRLMQAAIVTSSSLTYENRHQAAKAALQHRLPVIAAFRESVEAGMLMSYGPNIAAIYRRAASYVDKVFKGTSSGVQHFSAPARCGHPAHSEPGLFSSGLALHEPRLA